MVYLKEQLGRALVTCALFLASGISAEQLAPPEHQVTDKFGVNLASGQVTTSLDTVSIGGDLGLTHNVSSHHSNFVFPARRDNGAQFSSSHTGLNDRYFGSARYSELAEDIYIDGVNYRLLKVMRVFDFQGSHDFKVLENGNLVGASSARTNYTYESLRDTRHQLKVDGENLKWIKPDGTISTFRRGASATAGGSGYLSEVLSPNGFSVQISMSGSTVHSVTTNTGYQLKYVYEDDNRIYTNTGPSIPYIDFPVGSLTWSKLNAKHVVGINNSKQYCSSAPKAVCSSISGWPKATFSWPAGMPDSLYVGESIFEVTHADGSTTEYHIESQDLRLTPLGSLHHGKVLTTVPYSPRLVGIKSRASETLDRNYKYSNIFNAVGSNPDVYQTGDSAGHPYKVSAPFGDGGYVIGTLLNPGGKDFSNWTRSDRGGVYSVNSSGDFGGIIEQVKTTKGTFNYQRSFANYFSSAIYLNGTSESYGYTRGNVTRISRNDGTSITAEYPSSCSSSNLKTCNNANWIQDAKGKRTYYEYHTQSGQVQTITSPPNAQGLIAQTRYTYEEKFAKRKLSSSGSPVTFDSGIWLIATESYCANSNYNNGCEKNDEVITHYEYDSDNLHLTGMVIEADGKKLRTCYAYDMYGNRISETTPNANLSSCPRS